MKKRFFLITLCISLFFTMHPAPAKAQWTDIAAVGQRAVKYITDLPGTIAQVASFNYTLGKDMSAAVTALAVNVQRVLALLAVQKATALLVGGGNDGTIIRDFNNYLYVSPHQRAMAQMNSFFNTVSRGRLSSLNYEGVGPNYDAYLVAQARMAIAGQPFTTNLQDIVTDPRYLFAGGNMKGLLTFMQCPNNPACYVLMSTAKYDLEFTKAQEIAKNENVSGFMPKKVNGRITQPASIAQNALLQIDQVGTQLIMAAEGGAGDTIKNTAAIQQIWTGAAISATARLTNYGISDEAGRQAIKNKNDQFPFSLAYSANGGIGVSIGGVTVNTGAASFNSNIQLFNLCVKANASLAGNGDTYVEIGGKKTLCPKTGTETNITKPTINFSLPSYNCSGKTGEEACEFLAGPNYTCGTNSRCVLK